MLKKWINIANKKLEDDMEKFRINIEVELLAKDRGEACTLGHDIVSFIKEDADIEEVISAEATTTVIQEDEHIETIIVEDQNEKISRVDIRKNAYGSYQAYFPNGVPVFDVRGSCVEDLLIAFSNDHMYVYRMDEEVRSPGVPPSAFKK
jgi:hypothetical protein